MSPAWRFFVDRGGTFTDIVAVTPDGRVLVRKVLSEETRDTGDGSSHGAAVAAMRALAGRERIESVRMGTTVATNALLERRVEPTCLAITKGFVGVAPQLRADSHDGVSIQSGEGSFYGN